MAILGQRGSIGAAGLALGPRVDGIGHGKRGEKKGKGSLNLHFICLYLEKNKL